MTSSKGIGCHILFSRDEATLYDYVGRFVIILLFRAFRRTKSDWYRVYGFFFIQFPISSFYSNVKKQNQWLVMAFLVLIPTLNEEMIDQRTFGLNLLRNSESELVVTARGNGLLEIKHQ